MKKILITGAAGFIGFHLSNRLCQSGHKVCGIDNMNDYYDPHLKEARLAHLSSHKNFDFVRADIADNAGLSEVFDKFKPDVVINLAAQAGVRYSLENPQAYINSNIVGFANVSEACKHHEVEHFIFASSSSVYGDNQKMPLSEGDATDTPLSLYAATKKSNELMAHSYAHLHGLRCTGLRFFTVYGPWGRPDMAYYKFTKAIYEGVPIQLYNSGDMLRDFTYIDDVVEGINLIIDKASDHSELFNVYNLGKGCPDKVTDMLDFLEKSIGKKAVIENAPQHPGDAYQTFADTHKLQNHYGFKPQTSLEEGLESFVRWYTDFYFSNNVTQKIFATA